MEKDGMVRTTEKQAKAEAEDKALVKAASMKPIISKPTSHEKRQTETEGCC